MRSDPNASMLAAVRRLGTVFDRFDEAASRRVGVNRSDLRALLAMEQGPVTAGHLANHLELTTGSVTALIQRLLNADLVDRTSDPDDGRIVRVSLRPAAFELLASIYRPAGQAVSGLAASLDGDDRQLVARTMTQIADLLDDTRRRDTSDATPDRRRSGPA